MLYFDCISKLSSIDVHTIKKDNCRGVVGTIEEIFWRGLMGSEILVSKWWLILLGGVRGCVYATGETLKLNSRYSSGVVNYSNLLMRMGDIDGSYALLETHLKGIHARDDKALNNLNIALAEKRLDKKADFLFRKALNNSAINSLASSS